MIANKLIESSMSKTKLDNLLKWVLAAVSAIVDFFRQIQYSFLFNIAIYSYLFLVSASVVFVFLFPSKQKCYAVSCRIKTKDKQTEILSVTLSKMHCIKLLF